MTDISKNDIALLTKRMQSHTKEEHAESDRKINMQLALVLTSRRLYGESISLFGAIYERLETILEKNQKHPHLGKFHHLLPDMKRFDGFQKDAAYYLTPIEGDKKISDTPELSTYLDRLDELERDDPVRLIAYVYHMYMAIFAGGYLIKKIVKNAMVLPRDSDEGVHAFSTNSTKESNISRDGRQIRNEIKRIMNEVIAPTLSEREVDCILEESLDVFRRNNAVAASIQTTATFKSVSARCRNFVIIPALAVLLATVYVLFWPMARSTRDS